MNEPVGAAGSSRFVARSPMPVDAATLYAWHLLPGAFERLLPPWERVEVLERSGPLEEGARVVIRVAAGPLALRWVALHGDFRDGRQFRDLQQHGPFASWSHTHRMIAESPHRSCLEDDIEFALPLGLPGRLLAGASTRRRLERMFAFRHQRCAADLERHAAFRDQPRLHVAISGAGGLVGRALGAFLGSGGHRVSRLVRRDAEGADEIRWDPLGGTVAVERLEGLDAVVHLAGENIAAGRWTAGQKRRIRDSRVDGTRLIAERLAGLRTPPATLICASAVGYYGDRGDELLDEGSAPGHGFLADTCRAWEAASVVAERAGIRVVRLRMGVVLGGAGGALARMRLPFRLGLGGRLGDGRQYMSWIALDDLVGAIHHALVDRRLAGAVNAVAPSPSRNRDFVHALGRALGRPALFPVPAPAIRLLFGEMGRELLLAGARVQPVRLGESGFAFRHADLEQALRFELGRKCRRPAGLQMSLDGVDLSP